MFPHESPRMLAPGLCIASHKPALPRWGFSHLGRQTERERIPKPRKKFLIKLGQPLLHWPFPTLIITQLPRSKFPSCGVRLHFLGRNAELSDSKKPPRMHASKADTDHLFCAVQSTNDAYARVSLVVRGADPMSLSLVLLGCVFDARESNLEAICHRQSIEGW